jgi:hypothetical protein
VFLGAVDQDEEVVGVTNQLPRRQPSGSSLPALLAGAHRGPLLGEELVEHRQRDVGQ